jgi:CheY-like chemotaxis protein
MPLPIYQHPSLTVLVDDSAAFLARLRCELGEAMTCEAFTDPLDALGWLRERHAASPRELLLSASACGAECSHRHCSVTLDVGGIARIGSRAERFMLPTVLVVDCRMAAMSGVDLCAALVDLPCKKIMLAGAGDELAALDAFNRGLIDRVIRKGDANLGDANLGADALGELARAIAALQQQYFAELSDALRAPLALHSYGFIGDPAVARVVRELSAEHAIVEHYLYAQPSGLLLVDAAGRARLMVIETAAGMDAHHEVARDSGAPPSLLAAIEARCIIPFFRDGDGMYADTVGERWYRYCEPAQVCNGDQPWFWALFDLDADELPQAAAPFARFRADRRRAA